MTYKHLKNVGFELPPASDGGKNVIQMALAITFIL